jgi:hypothetical protein
MNLVYTLLSVGGRRWRWGRRRRGERVKEDAA